MGTLEEKRDKQIKSKQNMDIKKKGLGDPEDGQFEEKLGGRTEKRKTKKKKGEFEPNGTDATSMVNKNMEKMKKKKRKEELRSDGTNSTSRVTEALDGSHMDIVEKHSKRKRTIDGEDLGKHEKGRKSNISGLDEDVHDDKMVDVTHDDLKKKKRRKYFRDNGAIELEEANINENGDGMFQEKEEDKCELEPKRKRKGKKEENRNENRDGKFREKEEDKYEVEPKRKRKRKKEENRNENKDGKFQEKEEDKYEVEPKRKRKRKKEESESSCNIEKDIKEEEHMRKGEAKKPKDGSKTNKKLEKASGYEEKGKSKFKGKSKATKTINNDSVKNSVSRKERKKVQFSDEVEVFSVPSDNTGKTKNKYIDEGDGLVWGKRFTKEEDAVILKAIDDYIQMKQLGERGREMIADCRKNKLKGCWKEITTCLPYRPYMPVYYRAQLLLRRNATPWSPEDFENLKQFQRVYGHQWKKFADLHLKNRKSVKDAWRIVKFENLKKGPWSQDEYQTLFDLVNLDLKLKAFTEQPKTHHVLKDNIAWEAISEKLGTRLHESCLTKWYNQLSSSMVRDGLWADTDDYRLIIALQKVDANCIEEVDWDNLLPHRDGEICLKRWLQMVRYIGDHKERPFIEKVEILAQRYCPDMLEYRSKKEEASSSK